MIPSPKKFCCSPSPVKQLPQRKEFLSKKNIDFVAVDVLNDAGGRDRLLALGVRNVPVVAKAAPSYSAEPRGRRRVRRSAWHRPHATATRAADHEWINVLRAVQRMSSDSG